MKCYLIMEVVAALNRKAKEYRDVADTFESIGKDDIAQSWDQAAEDYEDEAAKGTLHYGVGNCWSGV